MLWTRDASRHVRWRLRRIAGPCCAEAEEVVDLEATAFGGVIVAVAVAIEREASFLNDDVVEIRAVSWTSECGCTVLLSLRGGS